MGPRLAVDERHVPGRLTRRGRPRLVGAARRRAQSRGRRVTRNRKPRASLADRPLPLRAPQGRGPHEWGGATSMNWAEFSAAAPELAEFGRERIESTRMVTLGTIRGDGWPRVSPCEAYIVERDLLLGMMWRSKKALDLLRDPRST